MMAMSMISFGAAVTSRPDCHGIDFADQFANIPIVFTSGGGGNALMKA